MFDAFGVGEIPVPSATLAIIDSTRIMLLRVGFVLPVRNQGSPGGAKSHFAAKFSRLPAFAF
jgi:hypothetical protein